MATLAQPDGTPGDSALNQGHPSGWKALADLPEGPLDVVGDVHGELAALDSLLTHLGYRPDGTHPRGRRLVFLGDLIDRGPDSPGVVRRVADMVEGGAAVMVMGNHDLNAIAERTKKENTWLFAHDEVHPSETKATDRERDEILAFLRRQPVALQRPDLRVVHACWHDAALSALVEARDPVESLNTHRARIKAACAGVEDQAERNLRNQNENPIKIITSGPETRAAAPFFAGGKTRMETRGPWWNQYDCEPIVVFGHYWRVPVPKLRPDDGLFGAAPVNSMLGMGKAICIDYSVGGRATERRNGPEGGPFLGRLAALRWPERELVFDDGQHMTVIPPPQMGVAS